MQKIRGHINMRARKQLIRICFQTLVNNRRLIGMLGSGYVPRAAMDTRYRERGVSSGAAEVGMKFP